MYVLGPGFGESLVIRLHDGQWLVVDCCKDGSENLTSRVLDQFGAKDIALLVLTHPDLDHIDGVEDLTKKFQIGQVWRYPGAGTARDLLAKLRSTTDKRMEALARTLDAIDSLADANRVFDVSVPFTWSASGALVSAIAPVPRDISAFRKSLSDALIEWNKGKPELGHKVQEFLLGSSKTLGHHSNPLSVGLVVQWNGSRLLLGGDIESPSDPQRGWGGVVEVLTERNSLNLITDVTVAKVAHHGSRGAFSDSAWQLHSQSKPVALAVLTPFSKGSNPPPHKEVLESLRPRADMLGVTKGAVAKNPKGWKKSSFKPIKNVSACVVVVSIDSTGNTQVTGSKSAGVFVRNP